MKASECSRVSDGEGLQAPGVKRSAPGAPPPRRHTFAGLSVAGASALPLNPPPKSPIVNDNLNTLHPRCSSARSPTLLLFLRTAVPRCSHNPPSINPPKISPASPLAPPLDLPRSDPVTTISLRSLLACSIPPTSAVPALAPPASQAALARPLPALALLELASSLVACPFGSCEGIQLPSTVSESAKDMYKQVDDAKLFKGKSADAIVSGCIFIACRQLGCPRTFREIYTLTKVPKKEIGKIFKTLEKFLTQKNGPGSKSAAGSMSLGGGFKQSQSTSADQLLLRFCNKLNVSRTTSIMGMDLAQRISQSGVIAGRSPLSVAAACIYMISYLMGEGKTPKEISDVASVSDGTIRTAYKMLYAQRDELVLDEWLKKGGDKSRLPTS